MACAVGLAVLASCGGDDDGVGVGVGNGAARGCEIFGETWCERAVGCVIELGTLPSNERDLNYDVCVDVATASAQCDHAIDLGPTYDQCLDAIDSKPCADWNVPTSDLGGVVPPDTCRGQIVVRR